MWRKEDGSPQVSPEVSSQSGSTAKSGPNPISTQPTTNRAPACVSQGIKIKGEVTGAEDLFIDGIIEGKITMGNAGVTVGPNGTVKAEISARELVFRGRAEGKFTAEERIQIWHTARVEGELKSERISIEDGAELRGKVEAGKAAKPVVDLGARGKKGEHGKALDSASKDANRAPDTANAGAD